MYKDRGTLLSLFLKNVNFDANTSLTIFGSFMYAHIRGTNSFASFGLFSKLSKIMSRTRFGSRLKHPIKDCTISNTFSWFVFSPNSWFNSVCSFAKPSHSSRNKLNFRCL